MGLGCSGVGEGGVVGHFGRTNLHGEVNMGEWAVIKLGCPETILHRVKKDDDYKAYQAAIAWAKKHYCAAEVTVARPDSINLIRNRLEAQVEAMRRDGMTPHDTAIACGPSTPTCRCKCPDGPCEHVFDGPFIEHRDEDGCHTGTATCSRCGMEAIVHDLWVLP